MTMNYTAAGLQHAAEHLAGKTAAPTIASRIRAAGRLAESLERLAKTRNPTVTPDAHALKVEAKAKAAAVDLQRVRDGFTAAIQTRLADLETAITETANFKANDQASEIGQLSGPCRKMSAGRLCST